MTTLHTRTVFSDDRLTVSTVEVLELRADRTGRIRHLTGSLQPIAVVVAEPHGTYALDMDAQPVDIDQLNAMTASLSEAIIRSAS